MIEDAKSRQQLSKQQAVKFADKQMYMYLEKIIEKSSARTKLKTKQQELENSKKTVAELSERKEKLKE